jgi:hypothetical protein
MGPAGLAWLAERPGYGGYAIDKGLRPSWNELVEPLLAAARVALGPAA